MNDTKEQRYARRLRTYDALVGKCPRFDRKGKTMPYTSANGHMFSLFNKAGDIGIRFSKERQAQLIKDWNSTHFISYGAVMKGYVHVPEAMLANLDALATFLDESYDYVQTLEPK